MSQKSYNGSPTLYLIPTPIGNLDDITLRAIKILSAVDVIFAEDTRVARKLLNHLNIKKEVIASHMHNENITKIEVLNRLKKGEIIAFISDRGTPTISDPGSQVVKYIVENNFNVVCLPGATAFVPALAVSGIDSYNFLFIGFLDSKENNRKKQLELLSSEPYTLIFYEAPHRILKLLNDIKKVLGDRHISISREISKKFEEVYRGSISSVSEELLEPRGEFVIIVTGYQQTNNELSINDNINVYIKQGFSSMDAIKKVAKERNIPKKDVYDEYHQIERR